MGNLELFESNIVNGLGTWSYTVVNPLWYKVDADATINPGSALSIVINQNGSPVATSLTPSPTAITSNVQANFYAVVGDVITVVTNSTSVVDLMPQAVKMIIVINNN